ncbi:hypothetical protein Bca4012_058909 [Brassica carinata]|uniref:Uncharacterized protein n=1 Tax=Brassica carinata TaxID=52824 RepID=A0A8X7W4D7_BRACI|nr:hypothetical protein Bca52824_016634 [Brassica carinata]
MTITLRRVTPPMMNSPEELENKASDPGDRTILVHKSATGKTMTERTSRYAITEAKRKGRSRSDLKVDDKERENSQTGINFPDRSREPKIEPRFEPKKAQNRHANSFNQHKVSKQDPI